MADEPPIKTVASRIVFQSRWTTLREDEIERPGGYGGSYAVIEKRRAALIIPWDGTHLHLVRQWRYPTAAWSTEFPQGTLNGPVGATSQPDEDEAPEIVARTELKEELGFTAGSLEQIGTLAFAPGISNQYCDVFLATDLEHGEQELEPEEQGLLTHVPTTPLEFVELMATGQITDSATMAAWAMLQQHGLPGPL
ncbi:MAG: NUDIX hydrolase [Solirubrobacteraceae bacterium]|nr:NUDIX hydrolase [Solirubrobacteraceae bacterium]